jgi:hypothetical protein
MGRKSRLFAYSISSPDTRFARQEVEIAESLRPCPRIFPFCGDSRRRLVRSRLPPEPDSPKANPSFVMTGSQVRVLFAAPAKLLKMLDFV